VSDLFAQRRDFAVAICRDLGLDANTVTRLVLRFEQDGGTWADVTVIPRKAFGDATEVLRRFALFATEVEPIEEGELLEVSGG